VLGGLPAEEVVRVDWQAVGVDRRLAAACVLQDPDQILWREQVRDADELVFAGSEVGEALLAEVALELSEVGALEFAAGVLATTSATPRSRTL
jgi:hypothetical protein